MLFRSPQKFKDLKIAYQILSNPSKRKTYTSALASTHSDLKDNYFEENDTGYGQIEDDFNRMGLTENQKKEKHVRFMSDFEKDRSNEERQLMDSMRTNEQKRNRPMTIEELLRRRNQEEDIPQHIQKKDFNINVFNQMLIMSKKVRIRDWT